MSLKELKRLAPWGWESKIATKKHKIGPKGLQEWEQIQRAIVGADLNDDGPSSGGGRDKFGGSKRLRSKDGLHPAAAPPSPETLMELTTPGHTTANKKATLLLAPHSNSSAAAAQAAPDSSLPHASSCRALPQTPAPPAAASWVPSASNGTIDAPQLPCADPCPSTAMKPGGAGSLSAAKTPAAAASAAKTPAAVRSGVPETPAGAILSKAFGTSPYAPTPVPYRGAAAAGKQPTGSISAAAAAPGEEPRRTRAQSHADGSTLTAGTSSRHGSSGSVLGAATAPSSRRSSGRSAGAMAGTPVPRFTLTSPSAMLPPAGRALGGSGPHQLQQASATALANAATATPAQPAGRACSAVLTPATAPRSAHSAAQGSGGPLSRCLSTPHSRGSAAACADTPTPGGLPAVLPNLLDLLAAASAGVDACSPEGSAGQGRPAAAAGAVEEGEMEHGPEGAAFSLDDLAATAAEAAAGLQQQCSGGIDSDQLMVDAEGLMAEASTVAAGTADAGSTPKDTTPAEQQDLPAAALATPGPQVIKALSGSAAAAAGIAAAPGSGDAGGASAAAGGATGRAHSGDSAGSVGGCKGSSSGGSTRAVSAMRLKKLWRESHAAAMAAAAAATAAKPDSPAAAAAAQAAEPAAAAAAAALAAEPRVLDLSDAEMAAANAAAATAATREDQEAPDSTRRAPSPDSLAVACSADLLLLAAAAEDEGAAWDEADVAAAAASSAAEQAQAARAAREAAAGSTAAAAPAAAAAGQGGKASGTKARRSGSNSSGGGPQPHAVAAARAAVSAALPRQPHAASAAPLRRHHTDSMAALPAARTAHVPAPAAAPAAGAPAPAAAAAVTSETTLALSNCSSSLVLPPAAQMRLMQLQQKQVGPGAVQPAVHNPVSRFHPVAANTRLHHVHTAGQMPPPRTSHTGVSLQLQPHPGHGLAAVGLGSPVAAAGAAGALSPVVGLVPAAPWGGAPGIGAVQQQQQQVHSVMRCGAEKGKGVQGKGAGAAPAAAGTPRAAAALDSLCTNSGSSGSSALVTPVLEIAPLAVPALLSDADSWRLAQSQPWLIEAVAAEARQLLLGASAAAAAAVTAAAAPAVAAAAAANSSLGGMVRAAALKVQGGQAGAVGVPHGCSGVQGPSVGGSAAAGGDRGAAAGKQQQQGQVLRARVLQARN